MIHEIESLGSEELELLESGYPGVDLDKVWIVEHGRKVPSDGRVLASLALGMALVGGGIVHWRQRADRGR